MDRRDRGHVRDLHGGARHDRGQRVAAAHRGEPVGDDRRVHVGPDVVPGRERDRAADDGLARADVRTQASADGVGDGLHDRVAAVRAGAEPADARRLPADPGRDGRRDAAALAGRAARSLPAGRSRQGDGLLGSRHRRRADPRSGARRMADRHLQLALGVLHQSAGRHHVDHHDAAVRLRPVVPAPGR